MFVQICNISPRFDSKMLCMFMLVCSNVYLIDVAADCDDDEDGEGEDGGDDSLDDEDEDGDEVGLNAIYSDNLDVCSN